MKDATHKGTVHVHNYGSPYTYFVLLRETKLHWIDQTGTKWRKRNGKRARSDAWDTHELDLKSIQPITPRPMGAAP